jgi:probable HAF family extracellular repeat protein
MGKGGKMKKLIYISMFLFFTLSIPNFAFSAYFINLGDLPDGDFGSSALGISADGNVVVGVGNSQKAFRWTKETGIVAIASGFSLSAANSVNADGSIIAGYVVESNGIYNAFRWTADTGIVGIGNLYGGNFHSAADGISDDGSVLVGYSQTAIDNEAFRWTQENGMVGLGHLPDGDPFSAANAVNADGSIIVGNGKSPPNTEAFLWSEESGMVGLGFLTDDFSSAAYGISADGTTVVG